LLERMPRHHEPPPPLCMAITNNGVRCQNAGRFNNDLVPHLHLCGQHRPQYERWFEQTGQHHTAGRCYRFVHHQHGPSTWCPSAADPDHAWCGRHRQAHVHVAPLLHPVDAGRAAIEAALDADWEQAFIEFQARRDAGMFGPGGVLAGFMDAHRDVVARREAGALVAGGGDPVPPPPPVPELGRIAQDRQNVHDGQVNRLTNEGIDRLCAIPVPAGRDTLRLVVHAFTGFEDVSYDTSMNVLDDMVMWWNTAHCRTMAPMAPDRLYRRTLKGLVAYIERVESVETKTELYRRLFQEASEAVGMCCDGHLARLVNVLVGFDDAYRPPVSQGELIQNRISAIAGLDVSVEERQRQANAFFDEIAVPEADRAPWLEALA